MDDDGIDDGIDEKRRVVPFFFCLDIVSLYPLTLDHTVSFPWVAFSFVSLVV